MKFLTAKNIEMNAKISKSRLMKRAWKIFRSNSEWSWSFADSLKRAWKIEKENIAYEERLRTYESEKANSIKEISWDGRIQFMSNAMTVSNYYDNSHTNTYFGD